MQSPKWDRLKICDRKVTCWDRLGLRWHFWRDLLLAGLLTGTIGCSGNSGVSPAEERPETATVSATARESVKPDREIEFTVLEPKTPPTPVDRQTGIELPTVDPLKVEGNLYVAGSFAASPAIEAMGDRFIEEGYAGIIEISGIGSSKGFQIFCQEGKSDLATASRPIRPSEVEACREIGREPVEFSIGMDVLTVVVHPENDFFDDATLEELARIFTVEKWSDVNPDWPSETIERFIPAPESGVFDIFVDSVFYGNSEPLLNLPNVKFFKDDEDFVVQSISTNPYSIGFFSFAFYERNKDLLKSISIEGLRPGIRNEYPLVYSLLLYADAEMIPQNTQVSAFLNYFLTHVKQQVVEVGYFPPSREILENEKVEFLTIQGYERFLDFDRAEELEFIE